MSSAIRAAAAVVIDMCVPAAMLLAAFAIAGLALAVRSGDAQSSPGAVGAKPITLEWVGDIALSSQQGLPPGGPSRALAPVSRILRSADITVGNLEGTLSEGGSSKCRSSSSGVCFAFQAPPYLAGQLRSLGFDLVNQANNHSLDYGPSGRRQTIAALQRAKLAFTGLPGQITYLRVRGRRIAFLGFAPYPYDGDLLNIPAAQQLIRRATRTASLVVVVIHAGAEGADRTHTPRGTEYYLGEDRGDPRGFAHAAIDAGASIVLGSGPHVVRGIERYRGRLIAYSLGNFVGYHTLGLGGVLSESAVLRVTLGAGGDVVAGRWISMSLVDGLPRRDFSNSSAKLVVALSKADFPRKHFVIGPSGLFHLSHQNGAISPESRRRPRHIIPSQLLAPPCGRPIGFAHPTGTSHEYTLAA
jgi:Bacterial capsule synthesis protein PGA_cap